MERLKELVVIKQSLAAKKEIHGNKRFYYLINDCLG